MLKDAWPVSYVFARLTESRSVVGATTGPSNAGIAVRSRPPPSHAASKAAVGNNAPYLYHFIAKPTVRSEICIYERRFRRTHACLGKKRLRCLDAHKGLPACMPLPRRLSEKKRLACDKISVRALSGLGPSARIGIAQGRRQRGPNHRWSCGDVAQLVEHRAGSARVRGSSPLISTIKSPRQSGDLFRCEPRCPTTSRGNAHGVPRIRPTVSRGCSSVGRASALQAEGQRFEPAHLQIRKA
jgi:hypothetical protein